MSPQESEPGGPRQGRPDEGSDDAGSGSGTGPVPPGWQQPWEPPAGRQPPAGQQPPTWGDRPSWQQPSPPPPQWQQQHGQQPGSPDQGSPYPGQPPYAGQPYGAPGYGGQPHYGSPYPGAPYGAPPYGQPRYVAPPKPGIIPLRPLMFGEVLDGSFQAMRRNAKAMVGAGLLTQALAAVITAVVTAVSASSAVSLAGWARTATRGDMASMAIGLMAGAAVVSILSVFLSAVLQGAMVVPVARAVLNRPTGFRRMMSLARPRIGALCGLAALLVAAAIAAMAVLAVILALFFTNVRGAASLFAFPLVLGIVALFAWVGIKVMVAPAAVVIEELGAFAGLRRSWELTRANWWRILGITLVVSILVGVISQVVLIPVSFLPAVLAGVVSPHGGSGQDATLAVVLGIVTAVVGALVGGVGFAFQTSVMALLYMDLRMRKDGLDITLLRQAETGADPDGIPGREPRPGTNTPYPGQGAAPGAWPYGR
ncbi:hypothetical protein ACFVVC_06315 [Pseudarthrobacter sp. NPDC058196]|uniref:DUF7847 domain-containing protein n=1 Tax=Pseudarthrobacter sp. NPDC058196 TaxID=3346376 RepID=UPI0036DA8FF5